MKSIFQNLFGSPQEGKQDPPVPFPLPVTVENLHEHQKCAMIGWMANRMGQKLRLDAGQSGNLIFLAFSGVSLPEEPDADHRYLLYLAACLVDWMVQDLDVYIKLKEMRLEDKYHRSLLETFEEVKQQAVQYLSAERSPESTTRTEDDEIWEVYRDVIHAATQGKFLLIHKNEVDPYKAGTFLCESLISERSDIPKARGLAKEKLMEIGIPQTVVMSHLLVISEAITNILKHAREGKMTIYVLDDVISVLVEDSGPGFPLKLLPNTTLMAGYSTKQSLGQGFTLMMKMAEKILLSTTTGEGSTLVLILNRK